MQLPSDFMAIVTKIFKLALIYGVTRFCANLVRPNTKLFTKIKESDEGKKNLVDII